MTAYDKFATAIVAVVVNRDGVIEVVKDRNGASVTFDAKAVLVKADGSVVAFGEAWHPIFSQRHAIGLTVDEHMANLDNLLAPQKAARIGGTYVGLVLDALAEHGYEVRKKL